MNDDDVETQPLKATWRANPVSDLRSQSLAVSAGRNATPRARSVLNLEPRNPIVPQTSGCPVLEHLHVILRSWLPCAAAMWALFTHTPKREPRVVGSPRDAASGTSSTFQIGPGVAGTKAYLV